MSKKLNKGEKQFFDAIRDLNKNPKSKKKLIALLKILKKMKPLKY